MMAVSASGASSAPLASCVRYVPGDHKASYPHTSPPGRVNCYSRQLRWPTLPLCLARYRPRTIIKHKVMKTTTATTPPIRAWSGPCCPRALGSEMSQREGGGGMWRDDINTCKTFSWCLTQLQTFYWTAMTIFCSFNYPDAAFFSSLSEQRLHSPQMSGCHI